MTVKICIIGAMKCATSSISAFLESHPDVFMVSGMDPQFFSDDKKFARGLDWYHGLFDKAKNNQIWVEGSNMYANPQRYPKSAERMAAYNPDMKIVYMVRDPIKRIASEWVQRRTDYGDSVPHRIADAVRERPESYIGNSDYWTVLQLYRHFFKDDQIFIGFVEDLHRDRDTFLARLSTFLDIRTLEEKDDTPRNPSTGKLVPNTRYSKVQKIPGLSILKAVLPQSLRTSVKQRFLSDRIKGTPELDPALRSEILAKIGDGTAKLLDYCEKPADFWGQLPLDQGSDK